jgi:hypothetical protein
MKGEMGTELGTMRSERISSAWDSSREAKSSMAAANWDPEKKFTFLLAMYLHPC